MMRIQIVIDDHTTLKTALFSDLELLLKGSEKEPKKSLVRATAVC